LGTRVKKNSVFILLILSLGLVFDRSYAQEFKFMAGGTFSKYSKAPAIGWHAEGFGTDIHAEYKPGFTAGIGVELFSANSLSLEIDGLCIQKGSRFDFSDLLYDRKMDFFLNVLSFPVLLKFKILPESSPYILAGSELSIVLSHRSKVILGGLKGPVEDERERVKGCDFSMVLGGGFEIFVKPVSVFIEARYHLGLRDISKDKLYFASLKTSAVAILLGLKIS
jgi:hypothetical protein